MKFFPGLFLVLFLLCGIAPAAVHADEAETYYLAADSLPADLLPPPPQEGSDVWKRNIAVVLAAQSHVDDEAIAAMRDEQHWRLGLMTDVMGAEFYREKYPKSYALLDRVFADSEKIVRADKDYWHTRRPYLTDVQVKLYVDRIDQSPAYPSGHTTGSRVMAEVLGMLDPSRLADLRARADMIAEHRIAAGVHYPDDVEGGKLLAMLIVGALTQSDAFQADLAAARAEIEQ